MNWSKEEIARCTELWAANKSGAEIAALLSHEWGRPLTKNSVICRMHRSGHSYRQKLTPQQVLGRPPRRLMSTADLEALRASERERDRERRAKNRGEPADAPPKKAKAQIAKQPTPTRPNAGLAKAAAPPPPSGIPEPLRIPLTEIGHGECRFICGDPLIEVPALCCGHQTQQGSSWCPGHHKLCIYTAPRGGSFVLHKRGAA